MKSCLFGVQVNQTVTSLGLYGNNLGEEGGKAIADVLKVCLFNLVVSEERDNHEI